MTLKTTILISYQSHRSGIEEIGLDLGLESATPARTQERKNGMGTEDDCHNRLQSTVKRQSMEASTAGVDPKRDSSSVAERSRRSVAELSKGNRAGE